MFFADSHAHLSSEDFPVEEIDDLLKRAHLAGVTHIINICTDIKSLERGIELLQRYPEVIRLTGATTPHDVDSLGEKDFSAFEQAAQLGLLAAIGETGLDYHHTHSERDTQKAFLKRYLQLADQIQKPVVIHCREAFADFFAIWDSLNMTIPGIMHCFTGTEEECSQAIERGFYISFSGIVTFKKSTQLQDVARTVPLQRLLIETDAPYLAPQSRRGRRNEPSFLPETAQYLAYLKNIDLSEMALQTTLNVKKLFGFF